MGVQQHLYFNKSELCRSEEVNRTSNIKVCLKGRRIWKNILFHNVFFYIVASFPLSEKLQKPNLVYPPVSFEALQPLLPLWARSRFCQIVPAEPESSTEKGSPILLFVFFFVIDSLQGQINLTSAFSSYLIKYAAFHRLT